MRIRTLEWTLGIMALFAFAAVMVLPYIGALGFRGEYRGLVPLCMKAFGVVALLSAVFVAAERRKIEASSSPDSRRRKEERLWRGMRWIGIALVLALACGYFIGTQF